MLIFTLIFSSKTNMSYKINLVAITNHPNFKIFLKNPYFLTFFIFFSPLFLIFILSILAFVA
jgi:hypothetical protein